MKTIQDCLYHKLLLPSAFKVYAFLYLNADANAIEVGVSEIANELRMSKETVATAIKDLIKYGFIKVDRYRKDEFGKTLPNKYALL